jgi:hypothetical protein
MTSIPKTDSTEAIAKVEGLVDLSDLARLAYIYGFPTYEVARLRYRALSLPRKGKPLALNTFLHSKHLTTSETGIVTAVNADMLLSRAWIDLSRGPLVLQVPDAPARYYSLALMDFFSNNFAVLGRCSTGKAVGNFLLIGPESKAVGSHGRIAIRAPTNAVWALVRILVRGPDDLAAVHALQTRFTISRSGLASDSTVRVADPLALPVLPLSSADPLVLFDVLNAVLTENPPPARDKEILDRLKTIGVGPSLRFIRDNHTPRQLDALREGLASARDLITAQVGFRTLAPEQSGARRWPSDGLLARVRSPLTASRASPGWDRGHGWGGPLGRVGDFGTDYLTRAQCALAGLGLLPPEEAMYFSTARDARGSMLDGSMQYFLRFPPGGLPPVDAFWSLTVYRTDENNQRWLVPNAIGRYSIGNQTLGLRYGRDGSLKISIRRHRPTPDETGNWLPVPEGPFLLTLRAYLPRSNLRDGTYAIPDVQIDCVPNNTAHCSVD